MKKTKPRFSPTRATMPAAVLAILTLLSCGPPSENSGPVSSVDLEREGRALFHTTLKTEFRQHPRAFSLTLRDVERILDSEARLPDLDRAVLRLLYLEQDGEFPDIPAPGDDPGPEFREAWLGLCRRGAARFIDSLFERENLPIPDDGARTVLEWALAGLGMGAEEISAPPAGSGGPAGLTAALKRTKIDRALSAGRGEGTRIVVIDTAGHPAGYPSSGGPPWEKRENGWDSPPDSLPSVAAARAAAPGAEILFRSVPFHPGSPRATWSAVHTALAVREAARLSARVIVVIPAFTRDFPFLRAACLEAYNRHGIIVAANGPDAGTGPETPQSFPAHYSTTLAVAALDPGRGGRLQPVPSAAVSHFIDLAAPGIGAAPGGAAALAGGTAALIAALMPPAEDELQGQYFQRIREILVLSADPEALNREYFDPQTGYGLLDAGRAVGAELAAYRVRRREIEENYKLRLKQRAEAEKKAEQDRLEAKAKKKE